MLAMSAATGSPAKDSVVVTRTPVGLSAGVHSRIPVIPFAGAAPEDPDSFVGAYTVDVMSSRRLTSEGPAGPERILRRRVGDVSLPSRLCIDVGVQSPARSWGVDVDRKVGECGRIAIDICKRRHVRLRSYHYRTRWVERMLARQLGRQGPARAGDGATVA